MKIDENTFVILKCSVCGVNFKCLVWLKCGMNLTIWKYRVIVMIV